MIMKKVTELQDNECILCTTEEECNAIMDLMHEAGLKWYDWDSYKKYRCMAFLTEQCHYPAIWRHCDKQYAIHNWHTIYPVSDFLFVPKTGDLVEVSDDGEKREKRIYLATLDGKDYPYVCVKWASNTDYINGKEFDCWTREYMRPINRKPRTIEATDEEWEKIQKQLWLS